MGEACGEIVGVGAMHDMREDPTLKCIRASFATPYYLQIALNLSGTLWGGSKLLIRKYKGPNHGKTNSNLLLAQNGFNLNGINNLPASLSNMSMTDIQQHQSSQQMNNIGAGINTLVNNGAINAGRGSNKTVAQQIFQHLDMQQLAYLMLVQQHITQNNQFKEQEERQKAARERRKQGIESDDESESDTDSDSDSDSDDDSNASASDKEVVNEQTNKNLNRKRRRSGSREYRSSRHRERDRAYYRDRERREDRYGDKKKRKKRKRSESVQREKNGKDVAMENGIKGKEDESVKKEEDEKKDNDYHRDRRRNRDRRGSKRRRRYRSYSRSRSRSRSRGRY